MSKKKINIGLIILVLALWGAIGFKTVNQYFFSKKIIFTDVQSNAKFNLRQIKKDTFNLEVINRDPFLNKSTVVQHHYNPVRKQINSQSKVVNKPIILPKPIADWPSVYYYGYIKSKGKTDELILVKIGNELHKLRKNAQIDGLIIKKVCNDSIEVLFNKEKRVIRVGN